MRPEPSATWKKASAWSRPTQRAGSRVAWHGSRVIQRAHWQKPEDRLQALHLLSQALRQGFGLDLVDQDPELDPLRNDPEFRRVVKAARDLQREVSAK